MAKTTKTANIAIRTEPETKQKLEQKAKDNGFSSLSEYLIFVGLNADIRVSVKKWNSLNYVWHYDIITAYRNYYQVDTCEIWEKLKSKGFANNHTNGLNLHFYYVTEEGKEYLKSLGYKWHEEKGKINYVWWNWYK